MNEFEGFLPETIDFLWELRMNNHKEWMEQNRERYKKVLKEPFDRLAAALAEKSGSFARGDMAVSVSRINRDTRYSKDKSPYRSCRWLVLHEPKVTGTNWKERPVFYFELRPEGYEYGLGFYHATPAYLGAYRKKIEGNPAAFARIVKKIEKDKTFALEGEDYKKIKNEALEPRLQGWYRKKELSVTTAGPLEDWLFGGDVAERLTREWSRLKELYEYLAEIEI